MDRRRRIKPASRPSDSQLSPWPFVGMIGMAATFFLYAASGLVAPWWGVTALLVVWFALFTLCLAWFTAHPKRLVAVAALSVVIWFVALVAGAAWLGWSA